jgi:uncharacterized RDD family membrane protein YckC
MPGIRESEDPDADSEEDWIVEDEPKEEAGVWPGTRVETDSGWRSWQGIPRAAGPTDGVSYAPFGLRFLAFLIDAVVLAWVAGVASTLISIVFIVWQPAEPFGDPGGPGRQIATTGLLILARVATTAAVAIYAWVALRATPGQRAMGLITVDAGTGKTLLPGQALARYLVLFAPVLVGLDISLWFSLVQFTPPDLNDPSSLTGLLVPAATLGWYAWLASSSWNDPRGRGVHDRIARSVVVQPTR